MGRLAAAALVLLLAACDERVRPPRDEPLPGGALPAQSEVRIAIDNPRGLGRQFWIHRPPDGKPPIVVAEQGAPDDQPLRDYRVELIKLMRLRDGKVVGANVALTRRRYDDQGRLRWTDAREPPTQVVGAIRDRTALTLADNVAGYVLILRGVDEDTGWRVLELDRTQVEDALRAALMIPDPTTLPLIDEHAERQAFWDAHAAAGRAYREAEGKP